MDVITAEDRGVRPPRRRSPVLRSLLAFRLFAALSIALALAASPAAAQTTNWTAGTGSWFTPGNWDNGAPSGGTATTNISNGGTSQISGAATAGASVLVNGGSTLELQSGSLFSLTGVLTVGANGTLLVSGSSALNIDVNMSGGSFLSTVDQTYQGNLTVTAGSSATFGATAGHTLSLSPPGGSLNFNGGAGTTVHFGSASNTGTVLLGDGTLTVSGSASAIAVDGGTLKIGAPIASNILDAASQVIVGSGATAATLDIAGNATTINNLTGTSAGTVTNSGSTIVTTLFNSVNTTFAGAIQDGPGSYLMGISGTGTTLTLTGANTYTGSTLVDNGQTLQIGNGGTTGSIVSDITLNGAATLGFNRFDDVTYAGVLSSAFAGDGVLTKDGVGKLTLSGNNSGFSGSARVFRGTLVLANANALGSANLSFAGDITALEATTSVTISSNMTVSSNVSTTFGATAGNTLTLAPVTLSIVGGAGTTLHFGSAADTGVRTAQLQSSPSTA